VASAAPTTADIAAANAAADGRAGTPSSAYITQTPGGMEGGDEADYDDMDYSDEESYDYDEYGDDEVEEAPEDLGIERLSLTPCPFKAALLANLSSSSTTSSSRSGSGSGHSWRTSSGSGGGATAYPEQKVFCARPLLVVEEVKGNTARKPTNRIGEYVPLEEDDGALSGSSSLTMAALVHQGVYVLCMREPCALCPVPCVCQACVFCASNTYNTCITCIELHAYAPLTPLPAHGHGHQWWTTRQPNCSSVRAATV
jgi:hypothetical protein